MQTEISLKKTVASVVLLFMAISLSAQIKVNTDGSVAIGKLTNTDFKFTFFHDDQYDHLSYLTRNFKKNQGIRLLTRGETHFYNENFDDYGNMTLVNANRALSKCWVVQYPDGHNQTFLVYGNGTVVHHGLSYKKVNDQLVSNGEAITDAMEILEGLGTVSLEVAGQKIETGIDFDDLSEQIPGAVMTDPQGIDYTSYELLIPVLVEAVKQQNKQIINLTTLVDQLRTPLSNGIQGTQVQEKKLPVTESEIIRRLEEMKKEMQQMEMLLKDKQN